jgi:hypothetical protein
MKNLAIVLVALSTIALPGFAQETSDQTSGSVGATCGTNCRGLGIEKVKAGDEHCGLVSRERKDRALDMACSLSEENREELQALATERASDKCSDEESRKECECTVEIRPWQNVYTHVLSQRCWTECGWAVLIECGVRSVDEGRADDEQ